MRQYVLQTLQCFLTSLLWLVLQNGSAWTYFSLFEPVMVQLVYYFLRGTSVSISTPQREGEQLFERL